jgi:7,8-dihydropterin-6-yl-methyl-4-(beta-D-ribofuranosyl)aminobenzene 5'-phosphate synthase
MIITALSENTSSRADIGCEHGLSLYIETKTHRLLFDTGVKSLFAENAEKLGVRLTNVDLAVISHGHYDHGGGLRAFMDLNSTANVYLSGRAFEKHFASRPGGVVESIGLDEALLPNKRIVLTGESCIIDGELTLFSNVERARLNPSGNTELLKQVGASHERDDFAHEQNLIICENGKKVLLSGCSHCGIVNILERFQRDQGCFPDVVIGGFHLYSPPTKKSEDPEIVLQIAEYLMHTNALFYTCHCTGLDSYHVLKEAMGGRIGYLSAGQTIEI